jgi:hypothetical protein
MSQWRNLLLDAEFWLLDSVAMHAGTTQSLDLAKRIRFFRHTKNSKLILSLFIRTHPCPILMISSRRLRFSISYQFLALSYFACVSLCLSACPVKFTPVGSAAYLIGVAKKNQHHLYGGGEINPRPAELFLQP